MIAFLQKLTEYFLQLLTKLKPKKQAVAPVIPITILPEPQWLTIARGEIGTVELKPGDNPMILEYHGVTWLKAKTDSVAWCAAFVSWCLEKAGVVSARSPRAKDYLSWGVELIEPKLGCIAVFNRAGGGHVAFYLSEDDHGIKVLGGNQSDSVSIAYYSKVNLIGYRWPKA